MKLKSRINGNIEESFPLLSKRKGSGEINWEIKTVLTSLLHWNFILWLPEDLCGIVGILNMNIRSWCVCEKESIHLISNMTKKLKILLKLSLLIRIGQKRQKARQIFCYKVP